MSWTTATSCWYAAVTQTRHPARGCGTLLQPHDLYISFYSGRVAGFWRRDAACVELRHLRYFVALADVGTFTHAAEEMFITQPTLNQRLR
jgi:hypothetical protein